MSNPNEGNEKEIDKQKEIQRILGFYNDTISKAATDFVKNIGENLLHWKGVEVNVTFDPKHPHLMSMQGGPTVQAIINIDYHDKDFKKTLYDIARAAINAWNPVVVPNSHKILHKKGDKLVSKRGELFFVIPLKFCKVSTYKRVTVKGPDGISVTVEDESGRRLDSDMLIEARIKLSQLLEWDNQEKEEE